mmetsp:Transcript_70403/g.187506  ORF Transcript_70403/g.187506 Transcript_70403/m.187506 type:complete len:845 (+) Transcript_70403:58-2592(+)
MLAQDSSPTLPKGKGLKEALEAPEMDRLISIDTAFQGLVAGRATFYSNLGLALRGAFAVTVVIGVFLQSGVMRSLPTIYQNPTLLAMIGFWVVLTLAPFLGPTIRNAWHATLGTGIALVNSVMMNGFFPGGAKAAPGNGYSLFAAWTDLIVVSFLILFLDFPDRTRTFALFYLAMFMMHFMNPDSHAIFSRGFVLDVNGTGVAYMAVCVVGTGIAILAILLPWPRRLVAVAEVEVVHLRQGVSLLLEEIILMYIGQNTSPAVRSKSSRNFYIVLEKIAVLNEKIEMMWWEGFDLFFLGAQRQLFVSFHVLLEDIMDIVHGLKLAADKTGTINEDLMVALRPEVLALVSATNKLLTSIVDALADGNISEEEKEVFAAECRQVRDMANNLSATYTARRAESGIPVLCVEHLEEDFAIYNMASLGECLIRFSLALSTPSPNQWFTSTVNAVLNVFDPLRHPNHLNFTLRGFVAFILGFILGMYFHNYSFVLAGTMALVLSKFMGSAIERNLGRAQGVVLGMVLPAIVVSQVPVCSGVLEMTTYLLLVGSFEFVALFVAFAAGPRFSYIALLTAAFAAKQFFNECTSVHDETVAASVAYAAVSATVQGIFIVLIVDLILVNQRPSEAVTLHVDAAFRKVEKMLYANMRGQRPAGEATHATLVKGDLALAMMQHQEAIHEPRFWRVAYPEKMVSSLLKHLEELRLDLSAVNRAIALGGGIEKRQGPHGTVVSTFVEGVVDGVIFEKVTDTEEFRVAVNDVLKQFEGIDGLVSSCLTHETEDPNPDLLKYVHRLGTAEHVHELAKAMSAHLEYSSAQVLDDTRCRSAVMICLLLNIHARLDGICETVLKS